MFIIGGTALSKGDPNLLTYAVDSSGYLCGTKPIVHSADAGKSGIIAPDFSKREVLFYYDIMTYSLIQFGLSPNVCVEKCPTTTIASGLTNDAFTCEYYGESGVTGLSDVDYWSTNYYSKLPPIGTQSQASSLLMAGPCYPNLVAYTPVMNRCVPTITEEQLLALASSGADTGSSTAKITENLVAMSSDSDKVHEYLEDLLKAWMVIVLCGFLGGLVFSIVYMTFLRYFAGCMAWVTVISFNVILIALTLYCALKGGLIGADEVGVSYGGSSTNATLTGNTTSWSVGEDSENAETFEYVTYLMAAITGIALLFTLLMIRRLMIAIAVLKVASQSIAAMPMILFSPVIPFVLNVIFFGWACMVAVYLYACGEINKTCTCPDNAESCLVTDETCTIKMEWDEDLQYMSLYHLFGIFWTTQFIVGLGVMFTAGAIAAYYWQRESMPKSPIRRSIHRAVRYHVGSIALGSFIVAVVQFIRAVLQYIDQKTKKMQEGNPILKYVMCCVKYCMWYLEKVLKYINRNAYILVAVKGYSYCYSAIHAIKLLIMNMARIAVINTVGDFLTFLGKIVVTGICGILAFLMCDMDQYTDPDSANYLSSPILPVLVVVFIAYQEADIFMGVYEMAIDTIMLSFCEDCNTSGGPHFAPPLLMSALGKSSKKTKPEDE